MVVTVKITGTKQVSRIMLNLGPELNRMISKAGQQFIQSVMRGAKLMVPRQTGALAASMYIKKTNKGNWMFVVDSPYGVAVEQGYKPHLVSSSSPTGARSTIAGVYGLPEGVTLLVKGSRRPHFVRDAFQNALSRLPNMLSQKTKQAIIQSRK